MSSYLNISQLKADQTAFDHTYKTKVSTESIDEYPAIRDARIDLVFAIDALLTNIEVMGVLDEASVKSVIDSLNEVITDIMTPVRARQTREVNVANAAAAATAARPVA
jgi:hypothetical protein